MNERKMRPVPTDLVEATLNRLGEGWSVEVEEHPEIKLTSVRFIYDLNYAGDYHIDKIRAFAELAFATWYCGVTHGGTHFMAEVSI